MNLPETMRAAIYYGAGDIRIERRPTPHPGPDDALVRVLRSGLCGTDLTEWTSGPHMIPLRAKHPHSQHEGPMIPGHEILGEVVSAPAHSDLRLGSLVVSGAQVPCGLCARCNEGRVNICERLFSLGLNTHGGHAEFVAGPVRSFIPVPNGMDANAAGLAQPLAVGLHAARRSGAASGHRILVSGAGAIGSFVIAGLRYLHADVHITAMDVDEVALERALRIGADAAVRAGVDDTARFDVTIEASGARGTIASCLTRTRAGGRVLVVGMPSSVVELDVYDMVLREITIDSTVALVGREDLAPSLEILASTNLTSEMLESVRPLGEVASVLNSMARGEVKGKVLLDPSR